VDVAEVLRVDEAVNVVVRCVGAGRCFAVFVDSDVDVVCDPDIEVSRTAGKDVDPEVILARWHWARVARDFRMVKGKSRSPAGMTTRKTSTGKCNSDGKNKCNSRSSAFGEG
jgi:hypothetical protein